MMLHVVNLLALLALITPVAGGPVGDVVNVVDDILGPLGSLRDAVLSGDLDGTFRELQKVQPIMERPENVEEAVERLQALVTDAPDDFNLIQLSGQMVAHGLTLGDISDLIDFAKGLFTGENSNQNVNPDPPTPVYPRADCDAPYTVPEASLRGAIYIPPTFTFGEKPPVILFPGTGSTGFIAFRGNFIPLLTDVPYADPVWVNVPGMLGDDAQINAEYAAYALNYVAALTERNVSIIAWSQGNIDAQWAFKYWPSTREVTSDHVAISADYKGTIIANLATPLGLVNAPSVLQQEAGSDFIRRMRAGGGDSSYVPTTSIYSAFLDEIVQPQAGTGASAFIRNSRGAGATNAEVQSVCAPGLGGTFYTHEGTLANPLAFALAKDALTHDGPGELSRLDLGEVCSTYLAPGLGLEEFLITESAIIIAALSLLLYQPKVFDEPALMDYATLQSPQCDS